MGLDTSHGCWHGPYSSFNRFRKSLGLQIGINIMEYEGFEGDKSWDTVDHPIKPLLMHSDCDGILTVEESKQIVEGFNMILANLNESLPMDYGFKENIIQFRLGCMNAVLKNEVVDFH